MDTKQESMVDVLGLAELDFDLDPTPTVGVPEPQGDLIFIPWREDCAPKERAKTIAQAKPLTAPVTLVEGRGGNKHMLVDPDNAGLSWFAYPDARQTLGVLVVPKGARACLDHKEHGRSAVGEGVWVIRRQREQADEIRMVKD